MLEASNVCSNIVADSAALLPATRIAALRIFWQEKARKVVFMLIRAFLIALAIVSVGSYIVLSPPVLTRLFPSLILSPAKAKADEYQLGYTLNTKPKDVFFKNAAGNTLHGWFFQAANPNAPVVLYSHGSGGNVAINIAGIARFVNAGASVLAYDYSGYGKSEGKASMAGALTDGDAAYDYLRKMQKLSADRIVIYGGSFGGGVACNIAATKPASGLILDSTFASLMQVGRKKVFFFNMYPPFLNPAPEMNNAALLKTIHMPVLIVHGKLDPVIPISEAEDNYANASEPKTLVELSKSSHWVADPDASNYQEAIRKFLSGLPKTKT